VLLAGLAVVTLAADVSYLRQGRRKYREAAAEIARLRKPGETFAILFDSRPMNAYLERPAEVLTAAELASRAPDWFTMVDENRISLPEAASLADRDYEVAFRLPSARGAVLGYRRK
jgi:hypothetical protein